MADTADTAHTESTHSPGTNRAMPDAAEMEAQRLDRAGRLFDLLPTLYLTPASVIQGVAFS